MVVTMPLRPLLTPPGAMTGQHDRYTHHKYAHRRQAQSSLEAENSDLRQQVLRTKELLEAPGHA